MDERIRQLERQAHTDPDAAIGLIRERLRIRDLSSSNVDMAAYMGDPACRRVVGIPCSYNPVESP